MNSARRSREDREHRRGLSTVIGAIFMVLLIAGALNVINWSLQQQNNVTQSIIQTQKSQINKLNEKLSISSANIQGGKFNVTVSNNGGSTAHLVSLYVVNNTASPNTHYRYNLNSYVAGGGSVMNIGQSLSLIANNAKLYTLKVVSDGGNSAVAEVAPAGGSPVSGPLLMSLYIIPPTVSSGQNVTILYAVTNNNTGSSPTAVTPTITPKLGCSGYPTPGCTTTLQTSVSSSQTIPAGQTALFKWVYTVAAPGTTSMSFNASLTTAVKGNYVKEYGSIQPVSAANVAQSALFADLVQKPSIFGVFPNPFGLPSSGTGVGLWGAIVANPTDAQMTVRRMTITLYTPRVSGDNMFATQGNPPDCNPVAINVQPAASLGSWNCPAVNTLVWKATGSPLTIPAHSVMPFLAEMGPGALSNGAGGDIQAFGVNLNVFTNMGQFAKAGYMSAMRQAGNNGPSANVYLSKAIADTSTAKMLGNLTSIKQGTTIKVNVTIANLNPYISGPNQIDIGTNLVIDIPKQFTNVTVTSSSGFSPTPSPVLFSDGSWQIAATLSTALTGTGAGGVAAKTVQFTMVAPAVTFNTLYLLYTLADGTADSSSFSVGPIAENVIQVIP